MLFPTLPSYFHDAILKASRVFIGVMLLVLLLPMYTAAQQPALTPPTLQLGEAVPQARAQESCTEEPLEPGIQFTYGGRVRELDEEGSTDVRASVQISGAAEFVVGTQDADRGAWLNFTADEGLLYIGTTKGGEEIDFWFEVRSLGAGTATYTFSAYDEGGLRGTFECDFVFGQELPAGLSGIKWNDANGNGQFDDGEEGLSGWSIQLNTGQSATTDGNGAYSFTDLEPGTYTVSEASQDGWTQTFPGGGGTHSIPLEAGQFVEGVNFGNEPVEQEEGRLVVDKEFTIDIPPLGLFPVSSHPLGPDELGLALIVSISITNASSDVAQNVVVEDEVPAGLAPEDPSDGCTINLTTVRCELGDLGPQETTTVDFITEPQELGDFVNTAMAVSDNVPGDEGAAEITIYDPAEKLEGASEPAEQTVSKGEQGTASFTVTNTSDDELFVPLDIYTGGGMVIIDATTSDGECGETGEGDTVCTAEVDGGDTFTTQVTVEGVEIGTSMIWVEVGGHEIATATLTVEEASLSLCGQKFLDADADGERDDESGLGGVVIELLDEAGTVIGTTRTDAADLDEDDVIDPFNEQGRFCFEDLAPGTYTVREVVPPGYEQTAPSAPGTVTVELTGGSQLPIRFGNAPVPIGDPPDDPPLDSVEVDFGDLPDPRSDVACRLGVSCYPTLFGNLGPWHVIDPDGPHLGDSVDDDMDGQPDATALGDDAFDGDDDEDGLVSHSIQPDGSIQFVLEATVPPNTTAFVDAWVDLDDDGLLQDIAPGAPPPPEYVLVRRPVDDGTNVLTTAPGLVDPDQHLSYARFRITSTGINSPVWGALDGEVEDHLLLGADFGDAPGGVDPDRPDFPGGYPTTLGQDGARHAASFNTRLGDHIDADDQVDGAFDAREDDDDAQQNDEDGIQFLDGFAEETHPEAGAHVGVIPGTTVRLLPLPSVEGKLDAWIDWNRDGDWDDAGEQVVTSEDVVPGMDEEDALTLEVPADAAPGFTYARFRFSRLGGLAPAGAAADGEVEDYLVSVAAPFDLNIQIANLALEGGGNDAAAGRSDGFDVYVDSVLVAAGVPFGAATGFMSATIGRTTVVVQVVDGDAPDNTSPLLATDVNLLDDEPPIGEAHTFIIAGRRTNPELFVKRSARREATDPMKVDVFLTHAAPDAPTVDASLTDRSSDEPLPDPLADSLAYGTMSGYIVLDPFTYDVEITATDGGTVQEVFRLDLGERAGEALALVFSSSSGDSSAVTLTAIDTSGARIDGEVVTSTDPADGAPSAFVLYGSYPNPVEAITTIRYELPKPAAVRLAVYDVLGRRVATLVDESRQPAGRHEAAFDAQDVPPGVYFYRIETRDFRDVKKMVVVH